MRFALLAVLLGSVSALATPQPLPFSYTYDTLPKGGLEIEQYVDLAPLLARSAATGVPAPELTTQLQTEIEYGVTDRLELALYVTVAPDPSTSLYNTQPVLTEGNGSKQRLRYRLGESGEWPLDVAFYFETSENERAFELEGKVILQRRVGPVRFVANLWAEEEFYYADRQETEINPTLGVTYEARPWFHAGIESWMHWEIPNTATVTTAFNLGPHIYVGPALMLNFGKLWWSAGAYVRTTDWDHAPAPGDAFGKVWIRTVFGIEL